jgi:non-homologous end joining protein Ku
MMVDQNVLGAGYISYHHVIKKKTHTHKNSPYSDSFSEHLTDVINSSSQTQYTAQHSAKRTVTFGVLG